MFFSIIIVFRHEKQASKSRHLLNNAMYYSGADTFYVPYSERYPL